MKCTCKDWGSEVLTGFMLESYAVGKADNCKVKPFTHCPWCGSPLLPDPVERTEWVAIEKLTTGREIGYTYDTQQALEQGVKVLQQVDPGSTFSLKSITTTERTLRVVRPK